MSAQIRDYSNVIEERGVEGLTAVDYTMIRRSPHA